MIREGLFVTWRKEMYPVSIELTGVFIYADKPLDGFREVAPGRYERNVMNDDIVGTYISTVGTWRGAPVKALYDDGDRVRIEYIGGQAPLAESLGMDRVDKGVYQTWASRADLPDLHEVSLR